MKSIKVLMNKSGNIAEQVYPGNNMYSFSLFSVVDGVNKQFGGWHGCRETLANVLCAYHREPKKWIYDVLPSLRATRLIVASRTAKVNYEEQAAEMKKQMIQALKALNVFEKGLGWSLSKLAVVSNEDLPEKGLSCYAFTGSVRWSRSTQLLSLYLLIIRLCRLPELFADFKSVDDLNSINRSFSSLLKENRTMYNKYATDFSYLGTIIPSISLILKNVDRLFFANTMKENLSSSQSYHGISSLVRFAAKPALLKTYRELLEEMKKVDKCNANSVDNK